MSTKQNIIRLPAPAIEPKGITANEEPLRMKCSGAKKVEVDSGSGFRLLKLVVSMLLIGLGIAVGFFYHHRGRIANEQIQRVQIHRLDLSGEKRGIIQEAESIISKDPVAFKQETRLRLQRTSDTAERLAIMAEISPRYAELQRRLARVEKSLNIDRLEIESLKHIDKDPFPVHAIINFIYAEVSKL